MRTHTYTLSRFIPLAAVVAALVTSSGCAKRIEAPVANPGEDQTVSTGAIVQMDGSQSGDPQGLRLNYFWSFDSLPPGSQAKLNDWRLVNPSFVADVPGEYVVSLVVHNGKLASAPAQVTITVSECGDAEPGIEGISFSPQAPVTDQTIQLSADASEPDNADPCNMGQELHYAWSIVAQPVGSLAALNNPSAANPSFTGDVPGDYEVSLVVTDSTGRSSAPAHATVTVSDCGDAAPSIDSLAAAPSAPAVGEVVQFTADATDADNAPPCNAGQDIAYSWTFLSIPAGSAAQLNDEGISDPSFEPDIPGDYVIQLVVTDSTGRSSAPASLVVAASTCGYAVPEVLDATATPGAPNTGETVQLQATVSDGDNESPCDMGQALIYSWSFVGLPPGSGAMMNDPSAEDPSFVADVPGDYVVRLVVTDDTGRQSAPYDLSITVSTCCSRDPVISSLLASPGAPDIGQAVWLGAMFDDLDNSEASCALGQSFTYQWWFTAMPQGSTAVLNDPGALTPSFTPDVPGDYSLALVVTDSTGRASQPQEITVTASVCGSADPVVSGILPSSTNPNTGDAVQLTASVSDADNSAPCSLAQALSYSWAIEALPTGSTATLNDPQAHNPSFTPDVPGDYLIRLVVTDDTGRSSSPVSVTVTAGVCGSNAPEARIIRVVPGPQQNCPGAQDISFSVNLGGGNIVQVDAGCSFDSDNQGSCSLGQTLLYRWSLFAAPAGSSASLSSETARNPWFRADRIGTYILRLWVSDGANISHVGTATITVF